MTCSQTTMTRALTPLEVSDCTKIMNTARKSSFKVRNKYALLASNPNNKYLVISIFVVRLASYRCCVFSCFLIYGMFYYFGFTMYRTVLATLTLEREGVGCLIEGQIDCQILEVLEARVLLLLIYIYTHYLKKIFPVWIRFFYSKIPLHPRFKQRQN